MLVDTWCGDSRRRRVSGISAMTITAPLSLNCRERPLVPLPTGRARVGHVRFNRRGCPRPTGGYLSQRARSAKCQSRIIRRHVLFVLAIRHVATSNLLRCNPIGANSGQRRSVLGDQRPSSPTLTTDRFRSRMTRSSKRRPLTIVLGSSSASDHRDRGRH